MTLTVRKPSVCDCAFILYFTYSIWKSVFNFLLPDDVATFCASFIMIFIFALAIFSTYKYKQQTLNDVVGIYVIVIVLFILTYLLNSGVRYCYWDDNWGIIRMLRFTSGGIWAYLAVRLVPDLNKLLADLRVVAYITFAFYLIQLFRMLPVGMWYIPDNQGVYNYSQYNMGFGYSMIFVAIVFLCFWVSRRKTTDIVIAGISMICAILWGSRGALICLAIAVLLLAIEQIRELKLSRRVIVIIGIIIVSLLIVVFYEPILTAVNNAIKQLGLTSRTLNSLLTGTYTNDAARNQIWRLVAERITTIFPLGLGTFGDRMIVMPYYAWGYSHNIILEMTISFGIFGIAFLVWLIYRFIKIFWSNKDCRMVLIIMLSMAARLLVSDSFWFNWAFWGLLAICISNRKSNGIKRRRK